MKNVNSLISERLKKGGPTSKMTAMAERSASGHLTSFAGLFSPKDLTNSEKESLAALLNEYATKETNLSYDLTELTLITSEVKAINNQAAILHGERIKRAHTLLRNYRDGAFTSWLIATYGNRQTPYNLMQYYEFHQNLPSELRPKLESMPRQAIYSLASRDGDYEKKLDLIENYQGEKKESLLALIRELFPLNERDKRTQNPLELVYKSLEKARFALSKVKSLSSKQKNELKEEFSNIKLLIDSLKMR